MSITREEYDARGPSAIHRVIAVAEDHTAGATWTRVGTGWRPVRLPGPPAVRPRREGAVQARPTANATAALRERHPCTRPSGPSAQDVLDSLADLRADVADLSERLDNMTPAGATGAEASAATEGERSTTAAASTTAAGATTAPRSNGARRTVAGALQLRDSSNRRLRMEASAGRRHALPCRRYTGVWGADPSTSSSGFRYRMELDFAGGGVKLSAGGTRIEGRLGWTLLAAPADRREHRLIGTKAMEHISGTYDPREGHLEFEGHDKTDPSRIIGTDKYRLRLSDDMRLITGVTRTHHGTWGAKIELRADGEPTDPQNGPRHAREGLL